MKTKVHVLLLIAFVIFPSVVTSAQPPDPICSPLVIIEENQGHNTVGELVFMTIGPQMSEPSISFSILNLPAGFNVSEYHEGDTILRITGSAVDPGTYEFSVAALFTGGCMDTLSFERSYDCPQRNGPYYTLSPGRFEVPPPFEGVPYSQTFEVTGSHYEFGTPHFEITHGVLPPGITLTSDGFSVTLSGVPTEPGPYEFMLNCLVGNCILVEDIYYLEVWPEDPCGVLKIDNMTSNGFVGGTIDLLIHTYAFPLGWYPVDYSVLSLPTGVELYDFEEGDPSLRLRGTIMTPGDHVFSVAASSSDGCADTLTFTTTYTCLDEQSAEHMTPAVLNEGVAGLIYGEQFSATGPPGMNYAMLEFELIAGALPPGLQLDDNGKLSGKPLSAGDYSFTVGASFGECPYVRSDYVLHIDPQVCSPLSITEEEPGHGFVGELVYYTFEPHPDPRDSIYFSVLNLPPGLAVDQYEEGDQTITVSGSISVPGTYEYSIAAHSTAGCADTLTFNKTYVCLPEADYRNMLPLPENFFKGEVGVPYRRYYSVTTDYEMDNSVLRFELLSGALPPGLILDNSGTVSGQPTSPGNYNFTLGAFFGECLYVRSDYEVQVNPLGCSPLAVMQGESGHGYVGEAMYFIFEPFPYEWDSIHYTVLNLPPGIEIWHHEEGYRSITVGGSISAPGTYEYSIAANSSGCADTVTFSRTYECLPESSYHNMMPYPEELSQFRGRVGLPYLAWYNVWTGYEMGLYPVFELLGGALPPGLILESNGKLSGTPLSAGSYNFTVGSFFGECLYVRSDYVLYVDPNPLKTLFIYSLCSESDQVRNWEIYNQNDVNVEVTWETLYYQLHSGSITAVPGDNFFTTPNVGGPNTIRIKWSDGAGDMKSIVKASINDLCDPPSCVVATSVDFYHQGLQKDANHIPWVFSNPANALGEPDANDTPGGGSQAFSLGYSGFIILQLNGNIADQPGNDIIVYEHSANNPSFYEYPERAEVFGSMNGRDWISLGQTSPSEECSQKLDTEFDLAGKMTACRFIKILDITNRHDRIRNSINCSPTAAFAFDNASNGFDLDAVTCVQSSGNLNSAARTKNHLTTRSTEETTPPQSVLSPNPTSGPLIIDLSGDQAFATQEGEKIELSIIDLNGVLLYRQQHQLDEQWHTTCNVHELSSGVFVARISTGFVTRYYKFVKY